MVTAIVAGCSSGTAPNSAANSTNSSTSVLQRAVQFSSCMRSNGVSNFPDPPASGQFTIDEIANGSGIDTNSATFTQALNTCKNLEPSGFTGTARTPQQQAAALQFAQCIRTNGVTDFPDPTADSPLVDTTRIPSADTSSGMSNLRAAMQKCSTFAQAAGATGRK